MMVRRPGLVAVIQDIKQHLDDKGSLPLGEFAGIKWTFPAAQLTWVPGKEYDETSPDAQFVWNLVKTQNIDSAWNAVKTSGTGNYVTRVDTTFRLLHKAATANTYGQAISGL